MGALDGIKVIDLSRVIAGPFCGQLLADNGAEVVKVEAPGGDMNRAFPVVLEPGQSSNFLCANRGKRGITLNLKSKDAQALLHRMVRRADVVLQSFLPATAKSLACDWETLSAINPDLIYASVSGYGRKGALAGKAGYDMMVAAYAGLMNLTGEPDRPPVRIGVPVVDVSTGILTYSGIVTALLARAQGKARGQRVDASLLESATTLLSFHGAAYLNGGHISQREGAGYTTLAPYAPYRAADGEMLVGAPTQAGWLKLTEALEAPELASDPRFADNPTRCRNLDALREALEARLTTRPMAYWLEVLEAAGLPCAPINRIDQVLEDPQVRANDMVVTSTGADGRRIDLLGLPFKLSATPGNPGIAPPNPGEHTHEVLAEWLGMGRPEVEALAAKGVF